MCLQRNYSSLRRRWWEVIIVVTSVNRDADIHYFRWSVERGSRNMKIK